MNKKKAAEKMAPLNDLNAKGREEIATNLNPLVADAFALYIKTKNFHWHVAGRHFRDHHLLFDEQAEQIFAMIDPLAERVRKLGGTTIHSTGEVVRLQRVKDSDALLLDPKTMLKTLMQDNKGYAAHLRTTHAVCAKYNDVATASILEIFIDETERRIWFLFETLSEN